MSTHNKNADRLSLEDARWLESLAQKCVLRNFSSEQASLLAIAARIEAALASRSPQAPPPRQEFEPLSIQRTETCKHCRKFRSYHEQHAYCPLAAATQGAKEQG